MSEDIRKLVTVRQIAKIEAIEGADAIVAAYVGGWVSVVKKDQFLEGDSVLFFEIDAFLPKDVEEFEFLMSRGTRTVTGLDGEDVEGVVLRTMKLRGKVSQGLILPLLFGLNANSTQEQINEKMKEMGVFKYEKPLPSSGLEIRDFPGFIQKTDSERVQNLSEEFLQSLNPDEWVASEKIDGTSSTFWKDEDGVLHAAGRNWEIDLTRGSVYSKVAEMYKLDEVLPVNAFIQGEIFGEGIQGNPLKIHGVELAVFSNGFIKDEVANPEFDTWVELHYAPVLSLTLPESVSEAIEQVYDMKSHYNVKVQAEGIVWWNKNGETFDEVGKRSNFKSINAKFLLKHGG